MNPILPIHHQNQAEMQAYDSIEIVSTFGQPQAEYAAIRKSAGLLDLPQRGIVEITGKDRHAFLNNLFTNLTFNKETKSPIVAGECIYAFLLNLKGRIVLDTTFIELGDRTLVEMDVRLVDMLIKLLDRYLFAEQVKLTSKVGQLHEIAIHGPRAIEILKQECNIDSLAPSRCISTKLIGTDVVIWRDDLCGVEGYHLIVPTNQVVLIWDHLLTRYGQEIELGKRLLRPVGWAAFNATRIEAGRPLFGIDFELAEPSVPGAKAQAAEETSVRSPGVLPAETGLFDRAVSVTKGCYLGQEVVARMHARKQVARLLVGIRMQDDALPIAGQPVMDEKENQIGVVTSSTMSPVLSDAAIALAILKKPFFEAGTIVRVPAEGAMRTATVVALPFLNE